MTCTPGKAKKGKVAVTCSVKLDREAGDQGCRALPQGSPARRHQPRHAVAFTRASRLASVRLAPGRYALVVTYTLAGRRATLRQSLRVR